MDLERRNRHDVGGSCHGGEFRLPSGEVLVGWPSHRLPVEGVYRPVPPRTRADRCRG